jgi:hypothetical protein
VDRDENVQIENQNEKKIKTNSMDTIKSPMIIVGVVVSCVLYGSYELYKSKTQPKEESYLNVSGVEPRNDMNIQGGSRKNRKKNKSKRKYKN